MLQKEEIYRYSRQIILPEVGILGQERLKSSKVLVIGAGGLGCPIINYLVCSGVGNIGIVDHDHVDESNLHRQILYNVDDVGKKKATVVKEKMQLLNKFVSCSSYTVKVDENNVSDLIRNYDIIVDGSDNFECRYLVNDACVSLNKPMVYGAIYKFEGQVAVFNYQGGPTYRCLFPIHPKTNVIPNCADIGVISTLPGIVGLNMANEVLKIILQKGNILSDQLLIYNALQSSYNYIKLKRIVPMIELKEIKSEASIFDIRDYEKEAYVESEVSTLKDLSEKFTWCLDVRENWEKPQLNLKNIIQIPLDELEKNLDKIPREGRVLVFCQSGGRSKIAVHLLAKFHHYSNLTNLSHGINHINLNQ